MAISIQVFGNLGSDPELRYTDTGQAVCNFSIAHNDRRKNKTIWFRVAVWGKRGEFVKQYFSKGQPAFVVGELHDGTWTDKDGNERPQWEIEAHQVDFGGKKDEAADNQQDIPNF